MKSKKLLLVSGIAMALAGSNPTYASVELQQELRWAKSTNAQYYKSQADVTAYYVRYKKGRKGQVQSLLESSSRSQDMVINDQLDDYDTLIVTAPTKSLEALSANDDIEFIEEVPKHEIMAQVVPWNIDQFQARDVWDEDRDGIVDAGAPDGSGVKLCIIDTGFYAAHDDFQGIVHTGQSQINGEAYTEDGNGHGTHVAGTANAMNNNIGVVGVMPGGAELHIVKIFNNSGVWVNGQSNLATAAVACKDAGANAISMSLGGGSSQTEENIFQDLYDNHNIISIAAAGNDGNATASYPASYDSVISVAALRQSDNVANFSQYPATSYNPINPPANVEWDVVELSGGGENVLSTWPGPPHGNVPVLQVTNDGVDYSATQIAETSSGDVTQNLVDGGLCDNGDINASWNGSVVLCERGNIAFADKMNNVASNGGEAVVLFNNEAGTLNATCGGNCTSGGSIPGLALTQTEGLFLRANGLGLPTRVIADNGSGCVGCSGGYNAISGTSMATPGVAAGIAWAWSACSGPTGITNKELRQLLRDSARDLSGTHDQSGTPYGAGYDAHTGFGLVQLKDAQLLGNQRFGSICPIGLAVTPGDVEVCTLPTADTVDFAVTVDDNFAGTTNMSASGVPAGASGAFSVNPIVSPADSSVFTVSNLDGIASGQYPITLTATDQADANNMADSLVNLLTVDAMPTAMNLASPADAATDVLSKPTFTWNNASQAETYTFELATDSGFSNIIDSVTGLTGNSYTLANGLNGLTTYYWRVTAENICGFTPSSSRSFTTANEVCQVYTSTDVPKTIAASPAPGAVTSVLNVADSGTISDVNVVNFTGTHTWINDLIFKIESPASTEVTLMEDICLNQDNWDVEFDDDGLVGPLPCPPVDGNAYQPDQPLAGFNGEDMNGTWTLTVDDSAGGDGGSLDTWGLEICYAGSSNGPYTVGGAVSGLANGESVTLQNNSSDDLLLSANGGFTFATALNDAEAYAVTILSQPASQTCSINNGSGTIAGSNVANVVVTCLDNAATAVNDNYSVLEDSSANTLDVTANDNGGINGAVVDGVTQGSHGVVSVINAGADVNYVPSADYCGADTFSYTLVGGSSATVDVTIDCVNDAPDFNLNADAYIDVDNPMAQVLACGFNMGPGDENNSQVVSDISISIVSDPNGVITSADIDNSGQWSAVYSGNHGEVTVDVTLQDDGGTANGGSDSTTKQMTIHVRDYIYRGGFEAAAHCQ